MLTKELLESHAVLTGSWRNGAKLCPRGEVLERPEIVIANANVPWTFFNGAFLPAPVDSLKALEAAVAIAARYFTSQRAGWMFVLGEDWVTPPLRQQAPEVLQAHGLVPAGVLTGMVAERLAPPVRPLPALELREVTDQARRWHMADLNSLSYGLPLQAGRDSIDFESLFSDRRRGHVGYIQGEPVTCAGVVEVEGVACVGMVATLERLRRQGLAEAVMRHSLAEAHRIWGAGRTALHAAEAGTSLYLRMGYRPVGRFATYAAPPPT